MNDGGYSDSIHVAHVDGSDALTTLIELTGRSDLTIIYFYPKDCTSGCTIEALDFSRLAQEFAELGAQVIGVSKDSLASHHTFITQSQLTIPLISDTSTSLHQYFGAWGDKQMYGRKYQGVIRSTFILDKSARIITQYTNVKARGHAQQVLNDCTQIVSDHHTAQ